jgi:polyisoprenoid-binding protein YceI
MMLAGLSVAALACSAPVAPASVTPSPATASAPATTQASTVAAPASETVANVTAAAEDGSLRYTVVAEQSAAGYRVREQLANIASPVEAVGVTKSISGALVFDDDGAIVPEASKLTIDVSKLKSDQNNRDNYLRRNALQTDTYPTVTFVPTAVEGLAWPLPESGNATFQLTGDLTVRNITRPVTWQVTAGIAGDSVSGRAVTDFTFGDFGMTTPRTMMVLSVVDNIRLEFDFQLARAA